MSKTSVNVGTLGHINHGKTTLTQAILLTLRPDGGDDVPSYEEIARAPKRTFRGLAINITHVDYQSDSQHYVHVDCPGHADYAKSLASGGLHLDVGVLVVSTTDGVMPQTREHLRLARQANISKIVVFLNKVDFFDEEDRNDMIELVQMETQELLEDAGFDSDDALFVAGSALLAVEGDESAFGRAAIRSLMEIVDRMAAEVKPTPSLFLMPIEDVWVNHNRLTTATGRIERGTVKVGDVVDVVGLQETKTTMVVGMEVLRLNEHKTEGGPGDNVMLGLRRLKPEEVERGMVVCATGSTTAHTRFQCQVVMLSTEEGGRSKAFKSGYRPQFYFRTTDVTGSIALLGDRRIVLPGDINVALEVTLLKPLALEQGLLFAIREGGRTVGAGRVTRVLE